VDRARRRVSLSARLCYGEPVRIPSAGSVLLLTLTGCPAPDDGATDPASSTAVDATSGTSTTSGTTSSTTTDPTTAAAATTGEPATTDSTDSTDSTTGDALPCACFQPSGSGGEFTILCPAPAKASASADCGGDTCTYDEAGITAALALLAAGAPGVVTWSVDQSDFLAPPHPRALATAANCSGQFCDGGIHILTGDGKVYSQEMEYNDLSGEIGPLVGATLRDASYFNMCAQNPELAARFACIRAAAEPPTFADECVPGDDLGYY
jgi:hypothetical protein